MGDVVTFDVGRMANSLTFTALEPPHRLAYDVRNALVVLPVVIELTPIDANTTRMTKSQTVEPVGFGRLLGPLLRRGIAQQVSAEADLIKQPLEQ